MFQVKQTHADGSKTIIGSLYSTREEAQQVVEAEYRNDWELFGHVTPTRTYEAVEIAESEHLVYMVNVEGTQANVAYLRVLDATLADVLRIAKRDGFSNCNIDHFNGEDQRRVATIRNGEVL